MSMTKKQFKYLSRLLKDANREEMLRVLYIRNVLDRQIKADLSDVTVEEASTLIQDLLSLVTGASDDDNEPFDSDDFTGGW
jgi:hypothetical protein